MDAAAQRSWMAQWRAAGPLLEQQRRRELQALTPERARAATEALLALGAAVERRGGRTPLN